MGEVFQLLLVEDNPADVELTKFNLEQAKIPVDLQVASDGEQALNYLYQRGEYDSVPRPDLILLDLNLPKINGQEVLEKIKTDADLKRIPVVVLTSSEAETDIVTSYNLHANAYITKPIGLDSFQGVVKIIEDFWLTIVKLPPSKM